MVEAPGGVLQGGKNGVALGVRVVGKDLLMRLASREEFQDILDPNAHTSDARSPTALVRIDSDTVEEVSHDELRAVGLG